MIAAERRGLPAGPNRRITGRRMTGRREAANAVLNPAAVLTTADVHLAAAPAAAIAAVAVHLAVTAVAVLPPRREVAGADGIKVARSGC